MVPPIGGHATQESRKPELVCEAGKNLGGDGSNPIQCERMKKKSTASSDDAIHPR